MGEVAEYRWTGETNVKPSRVEMGGAALAASATGPTTGREDRLDTWGNRDIEISASEQSKNVSLGALLSLDSSSSWPSNCETKIIQIRDVPVLRF